MREKNTRESDLTTIATLAAASLLFYFVFHKPFLVILAFALLLIGLFFEKAAALISSAWLKFSLVLGKINTRVLLGLVYFLFLTPLALVFRLFNRGSLGLANEPGAKTYFRELDHPFVPADFDKTW